MYQLLQNLLSLLLLYVVSLEEIALTGSSGGCAKSAKRITDSFISPLAILICPTSGRITTPNVSIVTYSPSNETTYLIYSMPTYKPCMIVVDVGCQVTI